MEWCNSEKIWNNSLFCKASISLISEKSDPKKLSYFEKLLSTEDERDMSEQTLESKPLGQIEELLDRYPDSQDQAALAQMSVHNNVELGSEDEAVKSYHLITDVETSADITVK